MSVCFTQNFIARSTLLNAVGLYEYCEHMHIMFHYMISETSTGFFAASDGKFLMAKLLVSQCLNMADILTI